MAFSKLTKDVLNISKLDDRVEGRATELKNLFDQAGLDIKTAFNKLVTELGSDTSASNLGAKKDTESITVQDFLDLLYEGREATGDVLGSIKLGTTLEWVNGKVEARGLPAPDEVARQQVKDLDTEIEKLDSKMDTEIENLDIKMDNNDLRSRIVSGDDLVVTDASPLESSLKIQGISRQGEGTTGSSITATPDNPKPIRTITGDVTVRVYGKNLWNPVADQSITKAEKILLNHVEIFQTYNSYNRTLSIKDNEFWCYPYEGSGSYYMWGSKYKGLKPNTKYTISCKYDLQGLTGGKTNQLFILHKWLGNTLSNCEGVEVKNTFTTDEKGEYQFTGDSGRFISSYCIEGVYVRVYDLMINEGEDKIEYEPFSYEKSLTIPLGDMRLCSLGTVKDELVKVDGVWNKKSKIGSVVLNGTESNLAIVTSYQYFQIIAPKAPTWCAFYNSHFPVEGSARPAMCGANQKERAWLHYTNWEIDTLDEFKTWLAEQYANGTPLTLVYSVSEYYEPITNSALSKALDELERFILYEGYNSIVAVSSNGASAPITLDYVINSEGAVNLAKYIKRAVSAVLAEQEG